MLMSQLNLSTLGGNKDESQIGYFNISDLLRFDDMATPRRDELNRYYWLIERGGGVAYINGRAISLRPGTFVKVPANAMHRLQLSSQTEGMIFRGADVFMRTRVAPGLHTDAATYQDFYFKPFVYRGLEGDTNNVKRERIATEIKTAAARLGLNCDAAVMGYIFVILADAGDTNTEVATASSPHELGQTDSYAELVYQFQILVERHFREHMPIECYCEMLSTSRIKLTEACKYSLQKTPLEILHDRTTAEAKNMLINTQMRISDIAYSLGFDDIAYFSRFFKNQTKLAPKTFRGAKL